jgi:hypothetical protein
MDFATTHETGREAIPIQSVWWHKISIQKSRINTKFESGAKVLAKEEWRSRNEKRETGK